MVYYFTSTVVDPSAFIYVGKDKFESTPVPPFRGMKWPTIPPPPVTKTDESRVRIDEELIKYGWEEDFHVDKLSSAHIYLRLPDPHPSTTPAMTWDAIPEPLLTDLAQLTKANSIEGNKKDNITIIYTPWSNLKKDGSMAVGQVSFKDPRKVKRVLVAQRENPVVNRLNKTKVEKKPDLAQEREDRLKELRKRDQAASLVRKKEEARVMQERKEKKWQKDHAYDDIFSEENMEGSSNQNRSEDWEDDFM
ncbi:Coiled-coil domain-containing protein 25 [Colletotrichum siamense]|nr:Coiled-coil domain-containing protein 25 [Colletotrichum siamense]